MGGAPVLPETVVVAGVDDQPVRTVELPQAGGHGAGVVHAHPVIGFAVQQQYRHAARQVFRPTKRRALP